MGRLLAVCMIFALAACDGTDTDVEERPFVLGSSDFEVDWGVTRDQELACDGEEIAGGSSSGEGEFTPIGRSTLEISSAWNIGDLLDPAVVQFDPTGPAGGPVAPVLGQNDYPYAFHFNPLTGACGAAVIATGAVELTTQNGDKVYGEVTGGETHRLDFVIQGDGIETFAIIEIVGGTGRFRNATGTFVAHTITRFDFDSSRFVMDLAEFLPGGIIAY